MVDWYVLKREYSESSKKKSRILPLYAVKLFFNQVSNKLEPEDVDQLITMVIEIDKQLGNHHNYAYACSALYRYFSFGKWTIKGLIENKDTAINSIVMFIKMY